MYLDVGGRVVAVASGPGARGPLAIVVRDLAALQPVAAGAPVRIVNGALELGHGEVVLAAAPLWDPALPVLPGAARTYAPAMRTVIATLSEYAPAASLAPLLHPTGEQAGRAHGHLLARCRASLSTIAGALYGGDGPERIAEAVTAVAGLGSGLTPSGDDLLMGILHALTVWPDLAAHTARAALRRATVETAGPRTTRISAAYLEAAAGGLATEPWHDLACALTRGSAHDRLRAAAIGVLALGETSGADGLTGLCWAWERGTRSGDRRSTTGNE
ncbi:MAG: DUF2877 domain-containing protein [Armatimonadota bacterium]|nr:DUF2877 domain-containing protein [Armatimonadota bacterium]